MENLLKMLYVVTLCYMERSESINVQFKFENIIFSSRKFWDNQYWAIQRRETTEPIISAFIERINYFLSYFSV